jgi:hypothetical protein
MFDAATARVVLRSAMKRNHEYLIDTAASCRPRLLNTSISHRTHNWRAVTGATDLLVLERSCSSTLHTGYHYYRNRGRLPAQPQPEHVETAAHKVPRGCFEIGSADGCNVQQKAFAVAGGASVF